MKLFLVGHHAARNDEGIRKTTNALYTAFEALGHQVVLGPLASRLFNASSWDQIIFVGGFTHRTIFKILFARMLHPRAQIKVVALYPKPEFRPGLLWRLVRFKLYASSDKLLHWAKTHKIDAIDMPVSGLDLDNFLAGAQVVPSPEPTKNRPLRLLHVGHVKTNRGLDDFIKLARTGEISLSMLASLSEPTDPVVMAMLRDAGVDVHTEFVSNLPTFYARYDLYVFTVKDSHGAISMPLSIIEALLSGLPVVSTSFGDVPKFFSSHPKVKIVSSLTDLSLQDMRNLVARKCEPTMQEDLRKFDSRVIARKLL